MSKDTQTVMFAADAVAIRTAALASPEGMFNALAFAVATANCPFMQSVNTLRVIRAWGSDIEFKVYAEITVEEKSLMGCGLTSMKLAAYQYLWLNREDIHRKYLECDALSEIENGHLIFWNYILDTLPGMGLVKAAFAVQMIFNKLGCIDIHNARELGHEKAPAGRSKKQRPVYLLIQAVKTSEQWWNDWCDFVAAKYPAQFANGIAVSRLHSLAVVGE